MRGSTSFCSRHIGSSGEDVAQMLAVIGVSSTETLIAETVPQALRLNRFLDLPPALSETDMLGMLKAIADRNVLAKSYIGAGYYSCITPAVIKRSILENPGWYTQYTPYQAEVSQGRLEALINFQTMVCDLTAMDMANASLLDEGTAAAEAMALCLRKAKKDKSRFLVIDGVHPQTIDVVATRAEPLGIEVERVAPEDVKTMELSDCFGVLLQYPATGGSVEDHRDLAAALRDAGVLIVVAADLLSLCLLAPPGSWGADMVVGNAQRFGVPLGFGGPHAAFFAVRKAYQRDIPGRLVGVSKDADGDVAYRLALQTREQHIRRERATSNICTAQVLLAVISSMYAVFHGPEGLRGIAERVCRFANVLATELRSRGVQVLNQTCFDTLAVSGTAEEITQVMALAESHFINFRRIDELTLGISLDETVDARDLAQLVSLFCKDAPSVEDIERAAENVDLKSQFGELLRPLGFLKHPVFNSYHSETEFMRYTERLRRKDLSLVDGMIPLGSCTMKLNAAASMEPITWPEFAALHPFIPEDQSSGFDRVISDLEYFLAEVTGMTAVSLQPNAGSQGEYAGLLAIRGYHQHRGEVERNVCLIPQSAHGTNPASAAMAGMKVVVVPCDAAGNVDLAALREAAERYRAELSALMITYPSTHGVFEEAVAEICNLIHDNGGLVYMDGANMNAMVGLCRPGDFGVDVCHLNLHKTFSIPHGGGGPGVGPIAVNDKLAPFLPGHAAFDDKETACSGAVSSAPWGSAGVLAIPWAYLRLMGAEGLKSATEMAILNANYVAERLEEHFPVLYRGIKGRVAHECILDCRGFKRSAGIEVMDIAKRLMDYGFHAPTVSFPVPGTLMVEPTESESKVELDRFCDAMILIRNEIREVEEGRADATNNVLKNAPHTMKLAAADEWPFPYTREKAVYPVAELKHDKFWPSVRRIEDAYGDRNLFCACVPVG